MASAEQNGQGTNGSGRSALRMPRTWAVRCGLGLVAFFALVGLSAPLITGYVTRFGPEELHGALALAPPGARDVPVHRPTYDGDDASFATLDVDGDGFLTCRRRPSPGEGVPLLPLLARDWPVIHDELVAAVAEIEAEGVPVRDILRHATGRLECPELDPWRRAWQRHFQHLVARWDGEGGRRDGALTVDEFPAWDDQLDDPALVGLDLVGPSAFQRLDADGDGRLTEAEVRRRTRHTRFEPELLLADHDHDGDLRISRDEFPGLPELQTFWLGTDASGRDVLARLLHGARVSLTVGLLATLVSLLVGVLYGATSGYLGGAADEAMMRVVDVLYGLPFPFLVILALSVVGQSVINLFILLGLVQWMTLARVTRGQVRGLRRAPFVEAAIVYGAPRRTVIFGHLARNAAGPVVAYATLMVPAIIVEEAFLSFLGLGVPTGTPSWGVLIADGARHVHDYPWLIVAPALLLAATLFAFYALGDAARRALDPRLEAASDKRLGGREPA